MNQLSEITYFTKRAGHAGALQLKNQYDYIAKLEAPLSERFPRVWDWDDLDKDVEYKMETIPYSTKLRDGFLGNPKDSFRPCLGSQDAIKILENVLSFALGDLATSKANDDVPDDYVEKTYWVKYERRLKETQDKIKDLLKLKTDCLKCAYLSYDFQDIYYLNWLDEHLEQEDLVFNNTVFKNPSYILNNLKENSDVKSKLTPSKLYHIHGDLHFDNILFNHEDTSFSEFKLIDPAGFLEGNDIAYDIGKMLHSCHGKYDFLQRMWFTLEPSQIDHKRGYNINIWSRPERWDINIGGGGSGSPIFRTEYILTGRENVCFNFIKSQLKSIVTRIFEQKDELKTDETWELRSYLMEALHFCTMMPFHIDMSAKLALALFGTGVQFLNEWSRKYAPQLLG